MEQVAQASPSTSAPKSFKQELREWAIAIPIMLAILSMPAFAQYSGDELGGGICKLVNVLTGKWLFGIAILATLGAGAALMFGAELTDGVKKLVTIITIVGMILSVGGILSFAFVKFSATSCS